MALIKFFFIFFALFDPQIPFAPNGVGFSLLISILLLPFAFFKVTSGHGSLLIYSGRFFYVLFFVSLIFILIRLLFNQGDNFLFLLSWLKAFFVFLSLLLTFLVFFNRAFEEGRVGSYVIPFVVLSYFLNAVINYVAGSLPGYFGFLSHFRGELLTESVGKNPYRNSFISGSGFFSIGTAYGLFFLLYALFLSRERAFKIFYVLILPFIGAAGFVAARTSFVAIFFGLLYLSKSRFFVFLWMIMLGGGTMFFLSLLPALSPYVDWMLSFFDIRNDASGKILFGDMYFWPGMKIFLFGMGVVNDGTFPYTDSGYMQDILFGGVFFLLIKLSFVLVMFFRFFNSFPLYIMLFCGSVLAFHLKGLFVYNNAQGMAILYVVYFYLTSMAYSRRFS